MSHVIRPGRPRERKRDFPPPDALARCLWGERGGTKRIDDKKVDDDGKKAKRSREEEKSKRSDKKKVRGND